MLQCTELLTAVYKLWKWKPPSPKAAIKPRSTDPSFSVYNLFWLSLFRLPPEHVQMNELKPTDISLRLSASFTPASRSHSKDKSQGAKSYWNLSLPPLPQFLPSITYQGKNNQDMFLVQRDKLKTNQEAESDNAGVC